MPSSPSADGYPGDLEPVFKAAFKGLLAGALASVLWLASDRVKVVDGYLDVTLLYWGFTISLFAMSFYDFMLALYHLPRRFSRSRIILRFLLFLCLSGAMYYIIST